MPDFTELTAFARHLLPFSRYPYRGRHVGCPVCGDARHEEVARIDRRLKCLPTVACSGCGLLFTNPMPTDDELSHYYRRMYRLDYQMALSGPKARHVRKRTRQSLKRASVVADLLPANGATLDFGAGSGEFIHAMLDKGFDAHGFDLGGSYGEHARGALGDRFRIQSWQEADYAPRFDLVSSFHVIEHLAVPVAAFAKMETWLKPGGKIYVEVPDLGTPQSNRGFGAFHFAHLLGFNHYNLRLAAARAGLRPARIQKPTGIIFERGPGEDASALKQAGLALARRAYGEASPTLSYFRHHWRKTRKWVGFNAGAAAVLEWPGAPVLGTLASV
ncbi:class I SAM-dependent methyltransferase [Mesorhizobium sp. RP14(2022)]|uniref:Class I SAM-dependent methyltransferase n=1 Tax=Mesorhizobium liriopis TaxID=2953882 RepID=A0ABT1C213_9HYPH|nr:class I SAM-dependent methyltransferase [Mesorhizobium liriopis]